MLRLNCFFQAHEGAYDDALQAALALVGETLQNDHGCVAYDCFESATRPNVFMICETWENPDVLAAHMATPHFKLYVGQLEKLGTLKLEQFEF